MMPLPHMTIVLDALLYLGAIALLPLPGWFEDDDHALPFPSPPLSPLSLSF